MTFADLLDRARCWSGAPGASRARGLPGAPGFCGAFALLATLALLGPAPAPLAAQVPDTAEAPGADSLTPDAAQDPALVPDEPPPNWAALELARSRDCVPILTRFDAIESELAPLRERMQRIEALHDAVSLEDSTRVSPLDENDPLERAVGEWFRADLELANRFLETEDEAIREERRAAREAMLERLEGAYEEVSQEASAILEANEDLERGMQRCRGRILVRPAVLEACEDDGGRVCDAARTEEREQAFQFVDSPEALWNVEQIRPWSEPSPIRPAPLGGLTGGRTESPTRRGNARVVVGVEPSIRARSVIPEEEVARFEEHMDSLGVEFEHPDFVMAPALTFEIDVPGRLGGETHYLLHFGDLSDPDRDVARSIPVPEEWPAVGFFAASEATLVRLARGDPISLTAARLEESGDETVADPVFTMGITPVLQSERVTTVLQYMVGGQLESDLAALVPPGSLEAEGN